MENVLKGAPGLHGACQRTVGLVCGGLLGRPSTQRREYRVTFLRQCPWLRMRAMIECRVISVCRPGKLCRSKAKNSCFR